MLNVGGPEVVVILLVALLVLGPKDLPRVMRAFGKARAEVAKYSGLLQAQAQTVMGPLNDVINDVSKPSADPAATEGQATPTPAAAEAATDLRPAATPTAGEAPTLTLATEAGPGAEGAATSPFADGADAADGEPAPVVPLRPAGVEHNDRAAG